MYVKFSMIRLLAHRFWSINFHVASQWRFCIEFVFNQSHRQWLQFSESNKYFMRNGFAKITFGNSAEMIYG